MTRSLPSTAMLLAAGRGTRLGDITHAVPKCMVPVAGRPLLQHTVEWLRRYGVTKLTINLHHLGEVIEGHFGDGSDFGVCITYSREPQLLGTAGAVAHARERFMQEPFFVWYGDNLSNCDLDRMWDLHCRQGGVGTLAVFHREDVAQSGIVGLDEGDRIIRFVEKPRPEQVFSNWVSAGIMLFEPEVLQFIRPGICDFGNDVLPTMLTAGLRLNGYKLGAAEGLWWIDTPDDLNRLNVVVKSGLFAAPDSTAPRNLARIVGT